MSDTSTLFTMLGVRARLTASVNKADGMLSSMPEGGAKGYGKALFTKSLPKTQITSIELTRGDKNTKLVVEITNRKGKVVSHTDEKVPLLTATNAPKTGEDIAKLLGKNRDESCKAALVTFAQKTSVQATITFKLENGNIVITSSDPQTEKPESK